MAVGLFFGNLFQPGKGMDLGQTSGATVSRTVMETPSLGETIMNIVPVNPFHAIISGDVLPTIFFCLVFGIAIANLKQSQESQTGHANRFCNQEQWGHAEKEMGVDKGVYSFSLPLGSTINMDGTAIYQGVCAIFIGFAIGSPLDFSQQMTIIATAVLASINSI